MSIVSNSEKIQKILSASQEVFMTCRIDSDLGTAFYASNPKTRYPWIYTRDFSAIIVGLSELGDFQTAKKCCEFLLNIQDVDGQWQQKYDAKGKVQNKEGIKPVVQEDNTPLAIWAILSYVKYSKDNDFQKTAELKIKKSFYWMENYHSAHLDKTGLVYSTTSIHQTPLYNQGYELWHNSLAVKAFFLFGEIYGESDFLKKAQELKNNISQKLVAENRFIRKLDDSLIKDLTPDIIMLAPAYFGIFAPEESLGDGLSYKEVLASTIKFLEKELQDKELGGFWRYPNYLYQELRSDYYGTMIDPLIPGPYLIASCLAARAYSAIDDKTKLLEMMQWFIDHNKDGQFPEHLTTRERFEKYKEKEQGYMAERKKDHVYLKGLQSNFKSMEEEARGQKILNYSLPLCWAQIEVLRLLKLTKAINKFKIKA